MVAAFEKKKRKQKELSQVLKTGHPELYRYFSKGMAWGLLVNKLIFLRLVSTPISVSRILVIAHYDYESAP